MKYVYCALLNRKLDTLAIVIFGNANSRVTEVESLWFNHLFDWPHPTAMDKKPTHYILALIHKNPSSRDSFASDYRMAKRHLDLTVFSDITCRVDSGSRWDCACRSSLIRFETTGSLKKNP